VKLLLRILALLGILLLAGLAWLTFADRPEPFPNGSASARRLAAGPYAVAGFEREFVDTRRPTAANGDFPGEPVRRLPASVWYPMGAAPAPLLVFTHGFNSMRENGAYLAEHLASHGFAVVAADYPLTNYAAPGGPNEMDVVAQPGDVSFLIDELLALSAAPAGGFSGILDGERFGAFGISLGGLTTTLVAFHPDFRDPRLDAAVSIAGPMAMFMPRFFAGAGLPFLMIAGDADVLVPYEENAADVPEKVPGGELLTLHRGSHTAFSGRTAMLRSFGNPDAIGCYFVLRNMHSSDAADWATLIGPPEIGIDYDSELRLCEVDPLPENMNVLRQQMITRVAVTAFFEKTLAGDPALREAARVFLAEQLPAELAEVHYATAARGAP
jgi:predicted dienelactone hydrolase